MNDRKLIPLTVAAVIALGMAGSAMALSGPSKMAMEFSAALNAETSIAQGIIMAERQTAGRAMEAELERENGVYLYEIKTVSKDKVFEVFVDPATGKIVRTDEQGFIAKFFDNEDKAQFAYMAASPVTLASAIATAEKETGGKTVEAEFENEDGTSMFEVKVVKDNTVRKVKIDASNGTVLNISDTKKHKDDDS